MIRDKMKASKGAQKLDKAIEDAEYLERTLGFKYKPKIRGILEVLYSIRSVAALKPME
jgi:hypothetical protein